MNLFLKSLICTRVHVCADVGLPPSCWHLTIQAAASHLTLQP